MPVRMNMIVPWHLAACVAALGLCAAPFRISAAEISRRPGIVPGLSFGTVQTYTVSGCPFEALPLASGAVVVSINTNSTACPGIPGIAVFAPTAGAGLAQKCFLPAP